MLSRAIVVYQSNKIQNVLTDVICVGPLCNVCNAHRCGIQYRNRYDHFEYEYIIYYVCSDFVIKNGQPKNK